MTAGIVARKRAALSKDAAKSAVSCTLGRLTHAHGTLTVADYAGCHPRTITEAKAENSLPELHLMLNLLALDATALDELLALVGYRLIPAQDTSTCFPSMLADMAGVVSTTASALADGRVDHREEAQIIDQLRPFLPDLNRIVAQHDARKAGRG